MLLSASENDFSTSVYKALDEIDSDWRSYKGTIIVGSHSPNGIDMKLFAIKQARENGLPFLGICLGYQLAAIEYARNVLGIKDATSEEFGQGTFVVKKRPEGLKVGLHGGESYWNNYEVDLPNWKIPKHFFITQSHPEYESSYWKPHPLLVNFIKYAKSM